MVDLAISWNDAWGCYSARSNDAWINIHLASERWDKNRLKYTWIDDDIDVDL